MPTTARKTASERKREQELAAEVAAQVAAAQKGPTAQEQALSDIFMLLREAGGGNINRNDAVTRRGKEYVIPEHQTLHEAAMFLEGLAHEQDEETTFSRVFKARPWDGAFCGYRVMKEVFGAVQHTHDVEQSMFGPVKVRPKMITINVAHNKTTQVPWGVFQLPGFKGCEFQFNSAFDPEKGQLFSIMVTAPKKYASEIEGYFNLIEVALREYSIYKGKAIDGGEMPEFLNLRLDPKKVVYTDKVAVQFEANVWSVIEDSELQRQAGLPLKRSILLHGEYGSGKSLFLMLTARVAVSSGWTFIRCRPGKDNYQEVLQTAALYAPSVVAFEDVDNLANADSTATDVAVLLDTFDGVTAKGVEIIALLTTNHPDRIHQGMVRPGRLDAVIEISNLDEPAVEKLVAALIPEDMLESNIDWHEVFVAMDGYVPAFIKEATDRAIRYCISRSKKQQAVQRINTADLVGAAEGLRAQLALMKSANDHTGYQPPMDRTFRRVVGEALERILDERFVSQSAEEMDASSTD